MIISYGFLISLFSLMGCVEPNGGTDSQIVVIGNPGTKTVILDAADGHYVESLMLTPNGLSPVADRLRPPVLSEPVSEPLVLQWSATDAHSNLILKATDI
jgi:hypothetical protein